MTKKKRIIPHVPVKIIVKQEFVGTKSLADAFVPIICEQLRREAENGRTLDKPNGMR